MRYRIEIGWGDADQTIVAVVEASSETAARRVAAGLLGELRVLRVVPDTRALARRPHTVQVEPEVHGEPFSESVLADDHSRWKRPPRR